VLARTIAIALGGVATLAVAPTARANPRPLPFTYTYETLADGEMELEQYADLTPVKALSAANGATAWYGATQFQTEFEYGITKRLELGLYVTLVPSAGNAFTNVPQMTEGNGIKQRLRVRLAEEGRWPLDVALYGELVENEREIEIEAKIILQRRIGDLRAVANLWAEREYYFENRRDWVLNPTLGLTYQVTPVFHPGVEGWMRAEFPDPAPSPRPFNVGPHVYAGPTMMFSFGRLWWSTGVYLRATDFGRSLAAGDAFGSVWFRTVVGVGF
jgi:hypothetical protein